MTDYLFITIVIVNVLTITSCIYLIIILLGIKKSIEIEAAHRGAWVSDCVKKLNKWKT